MLKFVAFCLVGLAVGGTAEAQSIAILSYNIHYGEGMDGKIDLRRIAAVIKSVSPDAVALQEVDRRTERSGGVDQAVELEQLTGLKMIFGRTVELQGGEYGNAILSRLPIKSFTNHPLPRTEGREARAVLAANLSCSLGISTIRGNQPTVWYLPNELRSWWPTIPRCLHCSLGT
jgi:endonuclease/exonuclease/phosphatase family metal-dependent hydrolase